VSLERPLPERLRRRAAGIEQTGAAIPSYDARLMRDAADGMDRRRLMGGLCPDEDDTKPAAKSKTNWLGAGLIVLGVVDYVTRDPVIAEYLSRWPLIVAGLGAVIVYLRSQTTRPVQFGKEFEHDS
jgi:hypothetical protein